MGALKGGADHDQVDCCYLLRLIRRNVGTGFNASADCPGGRHDHASRRRLRPGEDDGQPCVRGKNHHTPDPQGRPQMRAMARRRLRSVPVNWRLIDQLTLPTKVQAHLSPHRSRPRSACDEGAQRLATHEEYVLQRSVTAAFVRD